jgi:GMP synthase (glutamine-hydrolysing)
MKILVVDNNREPGCYGSANIVKLILKVTPPGTEVWVRRGPDRDLGFFRTTFQAMVISGSITSCLEKNEHWIDPYDQFLTDHIHKSTPMLGICYGHQSIARCLFKMHQQEVKLRIAKDAELGWATIQKKATDQQSPLLRGLPENFISYQSHYEEVEQQPPGTELLASSDRCQIQAYQVKDKPIFGIQFHPEYDIEEAESSLREKIKKGVRRDWILNPGQGPKLYNESIGKTIFGNFIDIVRQRNK